MNHHWLAAGMGAALLALASPALLAQATSGKKITFTMTTTVHTQGLTLPARTTTREVCMASQDIDPRRLIEANLKGDCKLDDYTRKGLTTTWRVHCTQPAKVDGTGKLVASADGGFTGTQQFDVAMAGRSMSTTTTYTGVPHGTCAYHPAGHG
ncbi:MAG TPA: DUF3617 family protein [Rhodanobacteraceae bacterium]